MKFPLTNTNARPLAIFDHDGVLVDSFELHQQAWLILGERTGLPITHDFFRETFGMTNPSILRRLLGDQYTTELGDRYGLWKEEAYREAASGQIRLLEGMPELLESLVQAGFALAIGSSAPRANLDLTVRECGLADRFTAIAALEDIQRGKPDPEVFLKAASKASADPRFTVVFEDAMVGIQAAKAAGMLAVGLTTTNPASELKKAGADLVIDANEFRRDPSVIASIMAWLGDHLTQRIVYENKF